MALSLRLLTEPAGAQAADGLPWWDEAHWGLAPGYDQPMILQEERPDESGDPFPAG